MIDKEWLEPWIPIDKNSEVFNTELFKEIGNLHPLFGLSINAIAKRVDCDDVLFELNRSFERYVVVHLTWRGKKETNPQCPKVRLFSTWEEWVKDCMMVDHYGYL